MNAQAARPAHPISATVRTRIAKPRAALFDYFIPIELPRILLGYGPIPAVVATSEQSGPWDRVGSTRTVRLADRSTACEQVTACERPEFFAYRVSEISSQLGRLVLEGRGQWRFTEVDRCSTEVSWTYTFAARSRLARLALIPVVRLLWRGYMRVGMRVFAGLAGEEAIDAQDAGAAVRGREA